MGVWKAETNFIKENYRKKSEKVRVEKLKKVRDSPESGRVFQERRRTQTFLVQNFYRATEEPGQRLR